MKTTLVILGALALAGCETSGGDATPCATTADCPTGLVCAKTEATPSAAGAPGKARTPGTVETDGDAFSFETREPAKGDAAAPVKNGYCAAPPSGLGALGDGGGTGGLGGLANGCMDITGIWEVTAGDCFPLGRFGTVTQNGCALTITADDVAISNATLSGSALGFTVTVTSTRGTANFACGTTLTSASVASGQCTVDIDGSTCALSVGRTQ